MAQCFAIPEGLRPFRLRGIAKRRLELAAAVDDFVESAALPIDSYAANLQEAMHGEKIGDTIIGLMTGKAILFKS